MKFKNGLERGGRIYDVTIFYEPGGESWKALDGLRLVGRFRSMKLDGNYVVQRAESDGDVRRCWAAYKELRPHLESEEELVERWRGQRKEGFEVIFIADGESAVAAAGYRFLNTLAWGRILYVDDLVALQSRHGTGLGTALLKYLQEEARRKGCDAVHLDTGYQRHLAHRAYLRNGFQFNCHHLAWSAK